MSKNVCLVGSEGKMGKNIRTVLAGDSFFGVLMGVDPYEEATADYISLEEVPVAEVDVVINFTNPKATLATALFCAKHGKPLVTGTTGLGEEELAELKQYAQQIAIMHAPNMSLGVNLIDAILPLLKPLAEEFDIELIEGHHRQKLDSPSGTALRWARTLAAAFNRRVVFGRTSGINQKRDMQEICVQALRGGTLPGEHRICFLGPDEVIEVYHRADSRLVFAKGAVKAAKWIIGQPAGFYGMKEVLGL
jgi:4-hydroxy-tetrahydrodipicolinate reductase